MAVPRQKAARDDQQTPARTRPRRREDEEPDDDDGPEAAAAPVAHEQAKDDDEEDEDFGELAVELRTPSRDAEVDQRQVESVTDRIFGSVLSKYGWQMDDRGRFEHVGEEDDGNGPPPTPVKKSERAAGRRTR